MQAADYFYRSSPIRVAGAAFREAVLALAAQRHGWTMRDLGQAARLGFDQVNLLLLGRHANALGRAKIESALGVALWESPERWERRQRVRAFVGFDPCVVDWWAVLRPAALRRGVRKCHRCRSREQLLTLIDTYMQRQQNNTVPAHG